MDRVHVESYLKVGDEFVAVRDVVRHDGDDEYVPGAISLVVDGVQVLGTELWDDVNWLWPFVVQALDECRRSGRGERWFPDQPIAFAAAAQGRADNILITVNGGSTIDRAVLAPARELYAATARAGLEFFDELARLCPAAIESEGSVAPREAAMLEEWLQAL